MDWVGGAKLVCLLGVLVPSWPPVGTGRASGGFSAARAGRREGLAGLRPSIAIWGVLRCYRSYRGRPRIAWGETLGIVTHERPIPHVLPVY